MRYAILGDIHSNLEALTAVMRSLAAERIDQYFSVGDLVGYAANPKECIRIFRGTGGISVAGNHDWASVNLYGLENFNQETQEALNWTNRNLREEEKDFLLGLKLVFKNEDFTLAHGSLNNPRDFNYLSDGYAAEETFRLMEAGICFVGHTHVAGVFIKDKEEFVYYSRDTSVNLKDENKYIVNVGSVGQPRDGDPHAAYCIYDTAKKEVQIKRLNYDVEAAKNKILAAGLPKFLAERILRGR